MTVYVLDRAEDDLVEGFDFYERQEEGLGGYFLDSLYAYNFVPKDVAFSEITEPVVIFSNCNLE